MIATRTMDAVVSDSDVSLIARECLADWEALSSDLGLNHAQETAIRNSFHDRYELQRRECLHKWKEMKGDEATYGALITAAESARNKLLADAVKALVRGMFVYMYTNWEHGIYTHRDTCNRL